MTTNEIEKVVEEYEQDIRMALIGAKNDPQAPKSTHYWEILQKLRSTLTTLTAKHEEEKAALYEAMTNQLYGMNLNISHAEQANMFREIEIVAAKHNVDLSKTDVTTTT